VRILLDTNVLLWWLFEPSRLTVPAHAALVDPANAVYASAVCAWEIAIKLSTGKLNVPHNVGQWLPAELIRHRFEPFPIRVHHVTAVEHLPRHHADPFDRLLVAQAQQDDLTLVTSDARLQAYGVGVLPCW
jgi:PIN domain nuclease of toxin-antitoxin system